MMNQKAKAVFFNYVANTYDETRIVPDSVLRKAFSIIDDETNLREHRIVLDAGIGTGILCSPLSQYDVEITGVDSSPIMLKKCRDNIRREKSKGKIRLIQGDVLHSPFKSSTFDIIIAMHLLPFIKRKKEMLREINRILKPNGFLIIMGYQNPILRSIVAKKYKELHRRYSENLRISIFKRIYRKVARIIHPETWFSYIRKFATFWKTERILWIQRVQTSRVLDILEQRIYSSYWNTPDDIQNRIIKEVKRWMKKENITNSETVECEFTIVTIQFKAEGTVSTNRLLHQITRRS